MQCHCHSDNRLSAAIPNLRRALLFLQTPKDTCPIQNRDAAIREFHTTVDYLLSDFDLLRVGNIAVKHSVALLFASVDSGEDYITVGGNEGDRVDAPSFLDKDCEWILIILFFRNILTARHGGDALVAAQNNNTSVIVNGVGLLIIEAWNQWKNHPNVTAVCILLPLYLFTNFKNPRQVASVWAGLSGSEVGNSY